MKIVTPICTTTLVLNDYLEPIGLCTARACIKHVITGRAEGIDADDVAYPWYSDTICWDNLNISIHEDQPALRSASKTYAIPTVIKCGRRFGYRSRRGTSISLRKCYKIYKGVCQYCLNHISFKDATKDHVYPKKHGGSNDDFNIVLACKSCNSKKGSLFPYFDVNGNEVKAKRILPSGNFIQDTVVRDEWKKYMFL